MDYVEIERSVMPLIRRKAATLRAVMDPEDAIQEARIVLFQALKSYDPDRQPDVKRYVARCLTNAFNTMYRKETALRRMPHVQFENGGRPAPARPDEYDDTQASSQDDSPEDAALCGIVHFLKTAEC